MIVVANRIQVTEGYEREFERRFEHRFGAVDHMQGFIRNEVLRPITGGHYIIMTHWETKEAFEAWTQSEEFKRAHANRPPKEMFAGPNVFEMHEVIQMAEKK